MKKLREHGEYIANTIINQLTHAYQHAGVDCVFLGDIDSAIVYLKEHKFALHEQQVSHFFQQHLPVRPHNH